MFIIVNINTYELLNFDSDLDYLDNGYPRLINKNIAYPNNFVTIHEVEEVPSDVVPEKYCYTKEDGFYLNPNWVEPDEDNTFGITDELYHEIIDTYTAQLIEEGTIV